MSTPADLAFVNGAVYTVDASSSWARAVAVRDGRIVAVGTDDEIREHVGSGTEVIDLAGKMLLPGFRTRTVTRRPAAWTACASP
jgi:predicted amidohydrolase YtcJ